MKWEITKERFSSGETLFCGKWKVGGFHYDAIEAHPGGRWIATCNLPGIKPNLGHFATQEAAKNKTESVVRYWIENLK